MTCEYTKKDAGTCYSFEFTDQDSKRYQTLNMGAKEAAAIADAVKTGQVVLSVGPWKSGFKSDSIFTIYHMTCGDRILIDYASIAAQMKKEGQLTVPAVAAGGGVFLVSVVIGVFVYRRTSRLAS
jgi:hypothetical protein